MPESTIEPVTVDVDDLALEPLGWSLQDVRARLVTDAPCHGKVSQRVAVSGTAHFTDTAWTDRFGAVTSRTPHVLVTVTRRGSGLLPSYAKVVAETTAAAARRPVRFTETSEAWQVQEPLTPQDLELRFTGYDFDSVPGTFRLPAGTARPVPVGIVDESTWPSLQIKAMTSAELSRGHFGDRLRINLDGIVELGTVEEILADRERHDVSPLDRFLDVPRVAVPALVLEVTDDTDFLLARHSLALPGTVPADAKAAARRRSPRFVAGWQLSTSSLAGTSAQVTIRIHDAADISLI
ncbi:hypothetical protein FB565_007029 [Actinoplanes lutulentus]|uniref:Uncharacterized protein n=1 Tax=Actinoplanes lutulentus TaxID=1287878 RepID=A0A327ZCT2_9ACTN|nr:hypothetical protein [Actinoplanes lutulentus]MBB2947261.1 hypothetical protein [Actinoplanes lutulentus]RAK36536.1 hypothetical protein B0I29_108126 [Actinoplanes lutulentus]